MRYFLIFFILSASAAAGCLSADEGVQPTPPGVSYYEDRAAQKAFAKQCGKFAKRTPQADAELQRLNPDWVIRSVWPADGGNQWIYAAAMVGQTIYFATVDGQDFTVMSYDGHEVKPLIVYPLLPVEAGVWGNKGQMEICGDRVLIVLMHKLLYGSLSARTLMPVDYLPPRFLGAFIHNDRIFMFGEAQLVSCDFNGKDWQVHFSSSQDDKIPQIEGRKRGITVTAASSGPNADTLWVQQGSNLYQYSISANTFTLMMEIPRYLVNFDAFRREGELLYFGSYDGAALYDTAQKTFSFIALKESSGVLNRQAALPDRYFVFKANHNIFGIGSFCLIGDWFLANGNDRRGYLISSGNPADSQSTVFRMSDYPQGPKLLFPGVIKWFPAPGGDGFVAVEVNRLTTVTYKPQPR